MNAPAVPNLYDRIETFVLQKGRRGVTPWLRERFAGIDPRFPIDHRFGEEPYILVAEFLKEVGQDSEAAVLIGESLRALLEEASARGLNDRAILRQIFILAQVVTVPACKGWLEEALASGRSDPGSHVKVLGESVFKELLRACRESLSVVLDPSDFEGYSEYRAVMNANAQTSLGFPRTAFGESSRSPDAIDPDTWGRN